MPKLLDQTDLTPTQQLAATRAIVKSIGALHEAGRQQLQLWPFAVDPELPAIGGSTATLDFGKFRVLYEWRNPDRAAGWKPDRAYLRRLDRLLDSGVRLVLGKAWGMTVTMNGKPIYPVNGSRSKSRNKPRPGAKRKPRRR